MNNQLSTKTTICNEYQRLLEQSQSTLEIWNGRRTEVGQSRLSKKEKGDELLKLQANFARAYALLQRHSQGCFLCQLLSRMEMCDSENNSDTTLYA